MVQLKRFGRGGAVICASLLAGGGVMALSGVANGASSAAAPNHIAISTVGGISFKPNGFLTQTARYDKSSYTIRSGGTITFLRGKNDTEPEPHTLTVIPPGELPRTAVQVFRCSPTAPPCNLVGAGNFPSKAHPHGNALVNVGKPGLDQAGDSLAIPPAPPAGPPGFPGTTVKVTAAPGTTLTFFCAVHPWMQAVLHVQ